MPDQRPTQPADPRVGEGSRAATVVMGLLAVLAFAAILVAGRRIDIFFDEWSFVLERRAWDAAALLEPHNEHIAVVPALVYKLWFAAFGLEPHWPLRALVAAAYAACGVVVYLLARPRVGAWGGVVCGALVLVMGRGAENILWAFQIGFVGSVLFGLLAFLALDRRDRRGDVLACAALVGSVLCSSLGVPLAIGVAAELVVTRRRSLWVPGVPALVYGLWWLGYGRGASDVTRDGVEQAVSWALDTAATAAGGALGMSLDWGRTLLLLLVVALIWQVARERPRVSPRLLGLVVVAVTFWGLTGAARSLRIEATSSRYITIGAIVLILVVAELLRGWRPPRAALGIGAAIVLFAGLASFPFARDYGNGLRQATGIVDAELGAVALAGASADPGYRPDPARAPQVTAGGFLAAVEDLESNPADSAAALPEAFNAERREADRVLQDIALRASAATPQARRSVACGPLLGREVTVPAAGVILVGRGQVAVGVRRFADDIANPPSPLPVRGPTVLSFARDGSPVPYRVRIDTVAGSVSLCR